MKRGSVSLETALITAMFLPMLLAFLLSSFNFYSLSTYNNDLNFQTGRYVSTAGCSIDKLSAINHMNLFKNFTVSVNGTKIKEGPNGDVIITCNDPSEKGSEFTVQTKVNSLPENNFGFFPIASVRTNIYVQEAN